MRCIYENSRPVSRVLYPPYGGLLSFILATDRSAAPATYPPTQPGQLKTSVYMVLQPAGRTATTVTRSTGRLLPYLFTLIPEGTVLFCYVSHTLTDIFPLRSTAPCVARTFLPPRRESDRTACYF